jgi:hypothetical protein
MRNKQLLRRPRLLHQRILHHTHNLRSSYRYVTHIHRHLHILIPRGTRRNLMHRFRTTQLLRMALYIRPHDNDTARLRRLGLHIYRFP